MANAHINANKLNNHIKPPKLDIRINRNVETKKKQHKIKKNISEKIRLGLADRSGFRFNFKRCYTQ